MNTRLLLAPLFLGSLSGVALAQTDAISQVGPLAINFDAFRDYNPAWVFTDAMKMARPWIGQFADTESPFTPGFTIPTTENGWPLPAPGLGAATLLLRDMDGVYPAGIYEAFWTGTGVLDFGLDATVIETPAPGHARLLVAPTYEGILVKVRASDPADPIRDIRVMMPGFANDTEQTFHPDFLEAIEPFGALRTMQWQNTNFSTLSEWSDRPTPELFSQAAEFGMSAEFMVELSNTTGKPLWVCMPYLASDDFVAQFARFAAQNLDPELPIFVEYSNEVWNQGFPAHFHATQAGLAAGLGPSGFDACLKWTSERAVRIFDLWNAEFEAVRGPGASEDVVRVMAAQHANPYTSETMLDHELAYLKVDALALAPYFGHQFGTPEQLNATLSKSVAQILAECTDEITQELGPRMAENVAVAEDRGLPLIAYEGGQHLVTVGPVQFHQALSEKLTAANRDPGMYDVYRTFLDAWNDAGAGFMTPYSFTFTYGVYGSWGHLEYLGQPMSETHKLRALLDYADTVTPPPATGNVTPFGTACGGLITGHFGDPHVGADFSPTLSGAPSLAPVNMLVATGAESFGAVPLPIELGYLGAPGCFLLIEPPVVVTTLSDGLGNASAPLSIPSNSALAGAEFFLQWTAPAPGFGLLGQVFSNGMRVTIGS